MTKARRASIAGIAAAGAAAVALTLVPTDGGSGSKAVAGTAPVAFEGSAGKPALLQLDSQKSAIETQVEKAAKAADAKSKAEAKAKLDAAVRKAAAERAADEAPASRTVAARTVAAPAAPAAVAYPNNLDGWIREAMSIMKKHGIPGSYEGLHRNIMRESSGNPMAINNWDINAVNGTPSKGLLQVIQPTFNAYHVKGTPFDLYHPVANIVAAANYAADRYGSIDNVFGAY
ncbi:transglycosylase SLT domain-containing protein [Streptomyces yaizuensis]|uniref:Transglycosylase SLT domain-containing protein n=2 Tax=Streptomyces yaizuensis TaxID=2989713 RepID=A0ABQ5P8Y3_9ACTN|nr:transglycosylase SLT domain-containing protein [Streptomyces sp. YSPA8]